MKLPNAAMANIREEKLTKYLLNLSHPDGLNKARFFMLCGFSPENPEELRSALLTHAQTTSVKETKTNPFGAKYVLEGTLAAPDGTYPKIVSIWIIEHENDYPELVTAYPS
ncbi:MAG: DUF6883 domain-containing protein [Saprospiraceae bacterium]